MNKYSNLEVCQAITVLSLEPEKRMDLSFVKHIALTYSSCLSKVNLFFFSMASVTLIESSLLQEIINYSFVMELYLMRICMMGYMWIFSILLI